MSAVASAWLLLCALLGVFAWVASRRLAVLSLPFVAVLAALSVYVPLGKPKPIRPAEGNYVVLGFDIQENVAIYVLLKGASGIPEYYQLPYSNNEASALHNSRDNAQAEGGSVQVSFGGDGDATIGVHRPPEPVKPPEPALP